MMHHPPPTPFQKLLLRATLVPWLLLLVGWLLAGTVRADLQDSFETPQTSWELIERDTPSCVVLKHERTFRQAHTGQACEHIRLRADHGTKVYYGVEVPPGRVIEELSIGLWLKANRRHVQLLARVVLPRTIDPHTKKPRRVLLLGSSYDGAGQWQQLTVRNPARQLKEQLPSLQSEFGKVDIREAFVEMVLLNAYGGAGETSLWIDDLELNGHIVTNTSEAALVEFTQASLSDVQVKGSQFVADERPLFLRIIEHNGEPFAWLKDLGFNVIHLAQPPTRSDLEQAQQVGVWLIAPPPLQADETQSLAQSPILAWDFGAQLGLQTLEPIREAALQVRPAGERLPLVTCAPQQGTSAYARSMDFLILDLPGGGSSHELSSFAERLRWRMDRAAFSGPFVAAVETEPPASAVAQWHAMDFPAPESVALEPEQLRLLAISAASSGVRGILFRSRSRLDGDQLASKLRSAVLELLNFDLKLMEPWTSGGRAAGAVDVAVPRVNGYSLLTEHAQLLVLCRSGSEHQHAVAPYIDDPLSIIAPTSFSSIRAYGLTLAGTQPLPTKRVAGGLQVDLEHLGTTGLILLTGEGLVVDRLAHLTSQSRDRRTALHQEVLSLSMEMTEKVQSEMMQQQNRGFRQYQYDVASHLQRSSQLTAQRDYRAFEIFIDRGANSLASLRRESWESAARRFASSAASPCCALYGSLPYHWQLAEQLRGRPWSGNALPAGDMEDMQQLLSSGWRRTTDDSGEGVCGAELSFDAPHSGRTSLMLAVRPPESALNRSTCDTPPQVITTAPVPVRAGQLVQVRGWVRAQSADTAPGGLLVIYDSIGGESLGELVHSEESWRAWTLYRAPGRDEQLTVHFAMLGPGTVWIDDVSVEYVDLSSRESK